jgi:hypothetical protein
MTRPRKTIEERIEVQAVDEEEDRPPRRSTTPRGPKYPLVEQPPSSAPEMTDTDAKDLARLVNTYGRDFVAEAAKTVRPRRRGRPSRGDLPYYEIMHLADWLDETAGDHCKDGKPAPKKQALLDLFEMTINEDERRAPGRFARFAKTTKKKWLRGRRDLQLAKEQAQRRDEWLRTQKKGRK